MMMTSDEYYKAMSYLCNATGPRAIPYPATGVRVLARYRERYWDGPDGPFCRPSPAVVEYRGRGWLATRVWLDRARGIAKERVLVPLLGDISQEEIPALVSAMETTGGNIILGAVVDEETFVAEDTIFILYDAGHEVLGAYRTRAEAEEAASRMTFAAEPVIEEYTLAELRDRDDLHHERAAAEEAGLL